LGRPGNLAPYSYTKSWINRRKVFERIVQQRILSFSFELGGVAPFAKPAVTNDLPTVFAAPRRNATKAIMLRKGAPHKPPAIVLLRAHASPANQRIYILQHLH
jgi:hypothetical protein